MKRPPVELPSPGVRFGGDFLARVGRVVARLAALRERREGAGRARLFGIGSEFVGFRPYRRGEDLRAVDWNLLARLGRPYVRVSAREASEAWVVALDTSASMGVGRPGKLQLGAELATALAALALSRGATVELWLPGAPRRCVARRPAALAGWMEVLEGVRAEGGDGTARLARELGAARSAGRVVLIGDFLDGEGHEFAGLARPSRELLLAEILAREELVPPRAEAVRWIDAEGQGVREVRLDEVTRGRYERRLEARRGRLTRVARGVRARAVHATSEQPFERLLAALLGEA